jgi:hypothetical protein
MKTIAATRRQLLAGILLTPLFFGIVTPLAIFSEGFHLEKQAISALSLGEYGWIQRANFIISGILAIISALGFRERLRNGKAALTGPALVILFGAGLFIAGIFSADPAFGFPKGAPEGMPPTMSSSALFHSVGFYCAFTALTIACFVFASRFLSDKKTGWALHSLITGAITPTLIGLGMTAFRDIAGLAFAASGLVSMAWLSILAYRFYKDATN